MSENYCFCFLVSTFFKTGTIAKPMITSRMMIAIGREKKYGDESALRCSHDQGSAEVGSRISARTTPRTRGAGFKSVDFHKVSDETEHEHDDNFVHAVAQCISTDAG